MPLKKIACISKQRKNKESDEPLKTFLLRKENESYYFAAFIVSFPLKLTYKSTMLQTKLSGMHTEAW
jgi:hypothetical protein